VYYLITDSTKLLTVKRSSVRFRYSPPITERDTDDLSLRPFFHLQKHLHDDAINRLKFYLLFPPFGLLAGLEAGLELGFAAGLLAGLVLGLLAGFVLGLDAGLVLGFAFGVEEGLVVGLELGLAEGCLETLLRL